MSELALGLGHLLFFKGSAHGVGKLLCLMAIRRKFFSEETALRPAASTFSVSKELPHYASPAPARLSFAFENKRDRSPIGEGDIHHLSERPRFHMKALCA